MTPISTVFNSLIHGKNDVCCLCLNTIQEEPIRVTDDVVININNEECDKKVEEVLSCIFKEGMNGYIKSFNSVCEQCIKLSISYYKFVQTSQKNADYFTNILDGVTNSFEYTSNEFMGSKSLFVSLNIKDFTSKHFYDVKRAPCSQKSALKRFHNLDNDIHKCNECQKEFPSIANLKSHCKRVHAPKKFKCPECPRSYGSAAYLEGHRKESHCTVVCSVCGKTFYNLHTLRMHERGHHLTLVCQDCGRVYKNKATFKKHKEQKVCGQETRAHPSEAKFTCDYCNKKYTQKMSLRVHMQYEHGTYKAHICEWCGKKFCSQSRLKAHSVKHTKEKNFACTMCDGRFVSKESLLYHTRTHTGERPYKCPHCDAKFLSASRRSDHVKRHHLGGTLECDICHSKFNSRQFLQKHKKSHMKLNETNLTSEVSKKPLNPNYTDQSKSVLKKKNLKPKIASKDIWKVDELDQVVIQSLENAIETDEVNIEDFTHNEYLEHNIPESQSSDCKVYLEVTDDTDDFMKLAGIGT